MPPPRPNRGDRIRRITESRNPRAVALDTKSAIEILRIINREDHTVATAVTKAIPEIARAVDWAVEALGAGGRLVYLGAGTSGRLGVLDAAECIPTFGTELVVAVMAGAPGSMFRPSEVSEDDAKLGVRDLRRIKFSRKDILIGISASGRTPYVLGGLRYARQLHARRVLLTSNPDSEGSRVAQLTIAVVTGPEVIAGSTRMKAATAQKMILNMLSTATMVRLGRVFSNLMIQVQLTNTKLRKRAEGILMESTGASAAEARQALEQSNRSLPTAMVMLARGIGREQAEELLRSGESTAEVVRRALARSR